MTSNSLKQEMTLGKNVKTEQKKNYKQEQQQNKNNNKYWHVLLVLLAFGD